MVTSVRHGFGMGLSRFCDKSLEKSLALTRAPLYYPPLERQIGPMRVWAIHNNRERGQMKKFLMASVVAFVAFSLVSSSYGTPAFTDNFNSYTTGINLAGQGPWTATTVGATPIQVVSPGKASVGASGQDDYAAFSSPVTLVDGTSFYYGLTLDVLTANANGDYFIHVSTPAGTTTTFVERLWARASGGGFQLGLMETSGVGGTTNWGSTVLSLNTDYRVVVAQHSIAGGVNDTFAVYVNPSDTSVELNNAAYLTKTWGSATAESASYAAINLRQGSTFGAPTEFVDNLAVSQTFSDVATVVPEPSTFLMVGAGLAGLLAIRRRRS